MGLESSFDSIDDLNSDWPLGTDPVSEGDDHIRGVKNALQANVGGSTLETRLLYAGEPTVVSDSIGVVISREVPGTAGAAAVIEGGISGENGGRLRLEGTPANAWAGLDNFTGGQLRALLKDGAQVAIVAQPDGSVSLYSNGVERLKSVNNGGESIGPQFNVNNEGANSDTTHRVRNSIGGMALKVASLNAQMSIEQTQPSGGLERPILDAFRDGAIRLFFGPDIKIQTTTNGGQVVGNLQATDAPVQPADTTRKDYVDGRARSTNDVGARVYGADVGADDNATGVRLETGLISTAAATSGTVNFDTPFRAGTIPNVSLTQFGGSTATDENAVVTAVDAASFSWSLLTGGGNLTYLAMGARA